ncbi:MATE family efflux transporter [Fusobacterium necrophorum]|nr:MATE family efflux transporter [Fusobacterium necrophorum]AYZ74775.1 MATE family efflux transporter [Fusobacterium necrophorum]AZW10339.1 MATE family efflux transporter [Fusobacterium necrophorum subsp. necrophorum]KDE71146.1 multidrug transporter MatE [Fusobacterium necrophorum DAB]MCF0163130.1 MATE family efflux transporter [Fusobacterium necrophorum]
MKKDMKTELLTESPKDLLFKLAIPGIIGMIVIGLYPFMDGIFAGWIIGDYAMSAISISMSLTIINGGISALIGVGSASVLSRAIGKGDKETTERIFGNFCYWVIVFSIIITILGLLLAPHFLNLVGAKGNIKELGLRYLRIVFLGSIFVNFAQAGNMTMRGEGALKQSMMIMGVGAVLNIILDPIFMKLMGKYAIEGAAIATVLSQIVQAILTFHYFSKKSAFVGIHKIQKCKTIYWEMFSIGSSAMMMQILFAVQQTFLFKQAFLYGGEDWGILMSATMRLYMFSFIPLWGMSQGLQPVIGANFGAKQYQRVKDTMKIFMYGATILAAVSWIPSMFFSEKLLSLFNVRSEIIKAGITNFKMFYSTFILYGIMIMTLTFFQSVGDGKKAGMIVVFRQLILFIPAILLLPKVFGGLVVWWAEPIVDFSMIMLGLLLMFKELNQMGEEKA